LPGGHEKIERAASGPFEITAESSFRFDGEAVCDPTLRQKKAKDGAPAFVEREGWATRPGRGFQVAADSKAAPEDGWLLL
jgi:hypothetical protein